MQGHESECPGICCFPGCTNDCDSIDHRSGKHICYQHKGAEFKPETRIRVTLRAIQPEGNDIYLTRELPLSATLSADNHANLERAASQMLSAMFQNKNVQTGL